MRKSFSALKNKMSPTAKKEVKEKKSFLLKESLPNKETAKAIEEARKGEGIVAFKSIGDMFEKLGI